MTGRGRTEILFAAAAAAAVRRYAYALKKKKNPGSHETNTSRVYNIINSAIQVIQVRLRRIKPTRRKR